MPGQLASSRLNLDQNTGFFLSYEFTTTPVSIAKYFGTSSNYYYSWIHKKLCQPTLCQGQIKCKCSTAGFRRPCW